MNNNKKKGSYIHIPDPVSNFYIHLTKKGFMTPENQDRINSYVGRASIQEVYQNNAKFIRNRYIKSRMYAKDIDANLQYRKEMEIIKSLYATMNSTETQGIYARKMTQLGDSVVLKIGGLHKKAAAFRATSQSAKELKQNIVKLGDYISELEELINSIQEYDSMAITLSAEAKGISREAFIAESKMAQGDYFLMSAFKTGQTSLKNLAEKVKAMRGALAANNYAKDTITQKVSYFDEGEQKKRTRVFSELLGGIPTQLTNIQGGIGEIMVLAIARDAIDRELIQPMFKTAGVKSVQIDASASGANTVADLELGLKTTSVSDTALTITSNGENGVSTTMSIGISAKAIFSDPKVKNKASSKGTTFGSTNVAGLLARAQLWNHENQFQYLFLNMLSKKRDTFDKHGASRDLYEESQSMRRYLAARVLRVMMGGLSQTTDASGNGDTVYFLKYQDAIYPVSDYFDKLATVAAQGNTIPIAAVSRGSEGNNEPLTPNKGESLEEVMFRRSKAVRAKILQMSATVSNTAGTMSLMKQLLSQK